MRAIRIDAHGGPEALRLVALPLPKLGAGMVLIRHAAIGVNFVDTQHRTGAPYAVTLPLIPGTEAAGVVVKVGSNVADIQVGDRVAYAAMHGVYAEYAAVPASVLVPVPDELDLSMAAAALLQGTTAHYLSHCAYPLGPGDHALVHAAAGGVGRLLVQFAKQRGATVIAMVSTEPKARIARADGADHVVIAPQGEFAQVVRGLTGGRGVDVVYDSVGRETFVESLAALRTRGMLVAYGQSSGPVPPFHITSLAGFDRGPQNGSLFVTWPANSDYNATRKQLLWRAATVFDGILAGTLRVEVVGRFSLNEAGSAHRLLESRSVTGKLLLIP
ncbi:MAG: quinone oxidoreductase [Roseiflexaceae bacterium]|nr:quinone oxidoreductase [Roseiflexaceae bacterium]